MGYKRMLVVILILTVLMVFTVGCQTEEAPQQEPETSEKEYDENVDVDSTEEVLEKEQVQGGRVYIQEDNLVVGTMIIKEGIQQSEIDTLANDLAKELKEKYPDKSVNVQAVQGGKNVANVQID
ncbi:hypothetical protein F8154_08315 [Alkaliphilus pronyensis]|uniref:Uncharacterized protein n=1 Tax=Alkaliphilus pronyensis TaxID=1482732 RepID=A0A6I0F4V6_9FIRM|nr:hypothetical protein [Alkaliphilus pronyensis]KAB3534719.1 hypothetical protein F8154_08315 [Alkaliphilus pronyensis]